MTDKQWNYIQIMCKILEIDDIENLKYMSKEEARDWISTHMKAYKRELLYAEMEFVESAGNGKFT